MTILLRYLFFSASTLVILFLREKGTFHFCNAKKKEKTQNIVVCTKQHQEVAKYLTTSKDFTRLDSLFQGLI